MNIEIILLVLALALSFSQVIRYDDYQVFRMIPKTMEQINQLHFLENNKLDLDFWRSPIAINSPVDIMLPPHKFAYIQEFMNSTQMEGNVMICNVQKLIDEDVKYQKRDTQFGWNRYYRAEQINDWLKELSKKYPDKVTLINIGKSSEGRDILGVKVTFKPQNKDVFLEGGIHAREWITPTTVTFILNYLLTTRNHEARKIIDNYNWHIFPLVNPDGYEYSHTNDRFWRKSRKRYNKRCYGADLNRNWDYYWMNGGATQTCNELFAGSSPFSEPETKALSSYITSIHENLTAYFAFHSYSQLLLTPYGYTKAHLDNYNELIDIGRKAVKILAKRYGTKYTVGSIVDLIYIASGGSMDWVKGNFKTPIVYTYELRDTGEHGFLLPTKQIIPTALETLDSLLAILKEAKARGY